MCFTIKRGHLQPVPYTRTSHWTYVFKRKKRAWKKFFKRSKAVYKENQIIKKADQIACSNSVLSNQLIMVFGYLVWHLIFWVLKKQTHIIESWRTEGLAGVFCCRFFLTDIDALGSPWLNSQSQAICWCVCYCKAMLNIRIDVLCKGIWIKLKSCFQKTK